MNDTETREKSSAPSAPTITLPRSRLVLDGGTLVRFSGVRADSAAIARHSLDEITDVAIESRWSIGAIVTAVVFTAGAVVAKLWISVAPWSWITCVACGVISLVALMGAKASFLLVTTNGGTVSYLLGDADEDCEGFLSSLRSQWEKKRGAP